MRLFWVLVGVFSAATAMASEPSFDCEKAGSSADEAICDSDGLAELDQELARIYSLAVVGDLSTERLNELKATQRGWIKGRDECWKSDLGLVPCVAAEYGFRIADLRTGYAGARSEEGPSVGPYPYVCDGLDVPLSVVFVNTQERLVTLSWRDGAVVLPSVAAASGARYAARGSEFWSSGNEAMLTIPELGSMSCALDSSG